MMGYRRMFGELGCKLGGSMCIVFEMCSGDMGIGMGGRLGMEWKMGSILMGKLLYIYS
jgi:hypothetical protein